MKQNFLFLLSIIPLQVFAQKADNSYECIYEYTVKTTNAENETYTTILQFDDIHARFADYAAFQLDSLMQTGKATEEQLKNETVVYPMGCRAFLSPWIRLRL